MSQEVDFYFDVMCPWAYQTSKWIREARTVRDLDITWRFFSLEERNVAEGKKHPWERPWSYGWSLLRIAAYLRRGPEGNHAVEQFYAIAGRMLHEDGLPVHTRAGVEAAMAELGHPTTLVAEALADESTNDDVKADHDRALSIGAYGVPTLLVDGQSTLFGPVVTPAPEGDAAGRLWDAVGAWAEFPHLYELQRPKTPQEMAHISEVFSPYSVARAGDTT